MTKNIGAGKLDFLKKGVDVDTNIYCYQMIAPDTHFIQENT